MKHPITVVVDIRAQVGEGPIWDANTNQLYWVDIMSGMLYCYNPISGKNVGYNVGQHVGTVVTRTSGGLLLATQNGFAAYDLIDQRLTAITDPESDLPNNRFNDGKCDPAGRFWAGTMAYSNQTTQGSLYRLDTDLSVHKMLGNIAISNGIVWSHDQKIMYYIDSLANTVRAFDYEIITGDITNERVVVQVHENMGVPDGMAIDANGMLWIAHFGGSCVRCWDSSTGRILDQIELPTTQITACAFGGEDLSTLYITSAALGLTPSTEEATRLAGSLFSAKPGVKGTPTFAFNG